MGKAASARSRRVTLREYLDGPRAPIAVRIDLALSQARRPSLDAMRATWISVRPPEPWLA